MFYTEHTVAVELQLFDEVTIQGVKSKLKELKSRQKH
jgi:hypothetical protein